MERAVERQTKYKLRDFIKLMASGITPKVTEYDKYYSDSTNGIPFLRVQNLSPEGLDYSDCRYINKETHFGILKRSQVFQGDLLIKITGVGRMAITSIAPEGFEGNINQHIVVVKTKNPEINEQIAAFLNSDIGEMLATHRSTGGTRPALDYAALRSIPIILNDDVPDIMKQAYEKKLEKEKEAQTLLESIDTYLLQELGIILPPKDKDLFKSRIFYVNSSSTLNSRFDPNYYQGEQEFSDSISKGKFLIYDFGKLILSIANGVEMRTYSEKGYRYLRVSDMSKNGIVDENVRYVSVDSIPHKIKLSLNDLLISRSGSLGLVDVVTDEIVESILSSHIFRVRLSHSVNEYYIQEFLRSSLGQHQFFKLNNGGIIPEIDQNALSRIKVCIPPRTKQDEIAAYIKQLRTKAKELLLEADQILAAAKEEVERILLRGSL